MRTLWTRTISAVSALLLIAMLGAAPAQAQLGIAGGLNFESSDDISGDVNANFDNSTGYHIGIVYDAGFGPVNIRPGFFYRKVGTYEFGNVTGGSAGSVDISTFEIPVDLRLNLLVTPVVKPYVLAGPMLTIPRSNADGFGDGDDFEDFTEDTSLSANVGAGVQISLPAVPFKLQPELRYEFGISDYVDTDAVQVSESPKFSAFSLRVNVIF